MLSTNTRDSLFHSEATEVIDLAELEGFQCDFSHAGALYGAVIGNGVGTGDAAMVAVETGFKVVELVVGNWAGTSTERSEPAENEVGGTCGLGTSSKASYMSLYADESAEIFDAFK